MHATSALDATVILALSFFASFVFRSLIVGERFDRALHSVDPTYRNLRDMGRQILFDPIDGIRTLPRSYGRYYGHHFEPVDDPVIEHLRHDALRVYLDVAILGFGGFIAVFVISSVLRRSAPGAFEPALIASELLLVGYWVRQLSVVGGETARSSMVILYTLAGLAVAIGAIAAIVVLWSG